MTEEEIETGILDNEMANRNALVFFRKIETECPKELEELKKIGYMDEDDKSQELLDKLKIKVEQKLSIENRRYFEVNMSIAQNYAFILLLKHFFFNFEFK